MALPTYTGTGRIVRPVSATGDPWGEDDTIGAQPAMATVYDNVPACMVNAGGSGEVSGSTLARYEWTLLLDPEWDVRKDDVWIDLSDGSAWRIRFVQRRSGFPGMTIAHTKCAIARADEGATA